MVETPLSKKLNEDMKTAMKSGDKDRLETIRMLKAGLQKVLIEKGAAVTGDDELAWLVVESKRRKEAIDMFAKGGRQDLADKEAKELEVINEFLPKQLSDDELKGIVEEAVKSTGAASAKDMGKVMGAIMPKVKGKADGKKIQEMVKAILGQ